MARKKRGRSEEIGALDAHDPRGVHPFLLCPAGRGWIVEELIEQMDAELDAGVWGGVVVDGLQRIWDLWF